jgi:transcriptional regulator with XRE-family HTH domain
MSVRNLADKAGISNPYLSQIERGLRKPSAEILMSIARGLSIRAETLYERAGLLDQDRDAAEVLAAVEADPQLDQGQKQALVQIYNSFIRDNEQEK